jgi:hypothetical protein
MHSKPKPVIDSSPECTPPKKKSRFTKYKAFLPSMDDDAEDGATKQKPVIVTKHTEESTSASDNSDSGPGSPVFGNDRYTMTNIIMFCMKTKLYK